jgi:hypothetical protein
MTLRLYVYRSEGPAGDTALISINYDMPEDDKAITEVINGLEALVKIKGGEVKND